MTPLFAQAVDPIFLATLDLESRIDNHAKIVTSDERFVLIQKIEYAESRLGRSEDWMLAKYAICAWIDAKLIQSSWSDASWWTEYCLEEHFFGHRLADEEFFIRANQAGSLPTKNALEVFFLTVVLGFRGIYQESDTFKRQSFLSNSRLPHSIEAWCREASRSLHLNSDRPRIPAELIVRGPNEPLSGQSNLLLFSMGTLFLIAAAIVVCLPLLFGMK